MRIVSDVAWCLTEDGKRVPMRHPLARFLLVGKGSEIEESELDRYPILEESNAKAIDQAPENKAIEEPPKRKRGRPFKKKQPVDDDE